MSVLPGLNKNVSKDGSSYSTIEQETALKRCFSMFDTEGKGKLNETNLEKVTECMGFDFISAKELLSKYVQPMGFDFEIFKTMVKDLANQFKKQEGRYYVLLSLEEAEHFRAVIHGRKNKRLLLSECQDVTSVTGDVNIDMNMTMNMNMNNNNSNKNNIAVTTAALWVISDFNAFMLGSSYGFSPAPSAQQSAMVNSFRFLNSDVYFDDKSITVLLRVLEGNTCEGREKWWTDVRACRRRRQIACDATMPVGTVFNTTTEFQFMEFKAVVERVRWALKEKGFLVFDAFRAFNSSNSGLMTCSELYGGLDFLGIPFTSEQVYDLVRKVAVYTEVRYSLIIFKSIR